jgi:hypothetical protein
MMQAMGVPFSFDTTQGRHVEDDSANASGIKVKSTRSARQFMNRRGGFNRPLPAERTVRSTRCLQGGVRSVTANSSGYARWSLAGVYLLLHCRGFRRLCQRTPLTLLTFCAG